MINRFTQIRKQLGKFIANFSVKEEDGKEYIYDGDIIREGLAISTYDENGDVIPLPDGEYTIQGVRVVMLEGLVQELPDKESKVEATEDPKPEEAPQKEEKPQEAPEKAPEEDSRLAELTAENESLKKELEALKKELEELKKVPMAEPVPQRTNMSAEGRMEIPQSVKGTRFEEAFRIFSCTNN